MIEILNKEKCCGCEACVNICPKNCISMQEDEEGFLYPVVDKTECIDCGACDKVCIYKNPPQAKHTPEVYAAFNKNAEEREKSSSGGLFVLFAKTVLREGGVVYGAAFTDQFSVMHIRIDSEKELRLLMGSKYVQSEIGDTYQNILSDLRSGKRVLFSGLPCQINALQKIVKENQNLICIDLICHGVPGKKLLKKYIKEEETKAGKKIEGMSFRDKSSGWKQYSVRLHFDDQTEKCQLNAKNAFMRLFLSDMLLRPSCYHCVSKNYHLSSDLTLGDFWGYAGNLDDNKGLSVVQIHTGKGREYFNKIKDELVYEKADMGKILQGNPMILHSVKEPAKRKKIFCEIDSLTVDELVNKYLKTTLKTKIKKALIRMKSIFRGERK